MVSYKCDGPKSQVVTQVADFSNKMREKISDLQKETSKEVTVCVCCTYRVI